jgi:hypothetical protein
MALSTRSEGLVRILVYAVQFEDDPLDGVGRVLEGIVDGGWLDGTPTEYLAATRAALASDEKLSDLVPQDHSEEVIRRFLAEIARRLEHRGGAERD